MQTVYVVRHNNAEYTFNHIENANAFALQCDSHVVVQRVRRQTPDITCEVCNARAYEVVCNTISRIMCMPCFAQFMYTHRGVYVAFDNTTQG